MQWFNWLSGMVKLAYDVKVYWLNAEEILDLRLHGSSDTCLDYLQLWIKSLLAWFGIFSAFSIIIDIVLFESGMINYDSMVF